MQTQQVRRTIRLLESLYDTIGRIKQSSDHPSLHVVKVESGTDIRISLKGLGEPIKEIKNLILTNEDGTRFTRAVVLDTLGLFKNGALIEEIPRTETVDNMKFVGWV